MDDKDIYSSLGRLGAQVESLTKIISEMRAEDKEYREEVKKELTKIKVAVVLIEESEPIIRDIKRWKERGIGAVMLTSLVMSLLISFGINIFEFIRMKVGF